MIKLNKSVEAGDLVGVPLCTVSVVALTLPDEHVSNVQIVVGNVGQLQGTGVEVDRLLSLVSAHHHSVSALHRLHLSQP